MNTLPKQKPVRFGERIDASVIAQLVGCSRQHLTRKCRAGRVPGAYQSKGGHWRARWSRWLAEWVVENSRLPRGSKQWRRMRTDGGPGWRDRLEEEMLRFRVECGAPLLSPDPTERDKQLRKSVDDWGARQSEVESLKKLRAQLTRRIQNIAAIMDSPLDDADQARMASCATRAADTSSAGAPISTVTRFACAR